MRRITKQDLKVLSNKDLVRFALFCAYQYEDSWINIPEYVNAVRVAELWLEGKVTAQECREVSVLEYAETDDDTREIYFAATHPVYIAYASVLTGDCAYTAAECAANSDAVASASKITHKRYTMSDWDNVYNKACSTLNNREKIIQEQWDFFYELRDFDKIAEQILIGG